MSITASEIQNVRFGEARRGYNPDEVDEFLEKVATDVDALNKALAEAASRLSEAEDRASTAEARASEVEERVSEAEERAESAERRAETATRQLAVKATETVSGSDSLPGSARSAGDGVINEDVISRAFIAAQISADNLKEEARKEAEKLYREADVKAKDIVRDAHNERERILNEIDSLRETSERFRTEFLSLINHYSTDAQKRFTQFSELVPGPVGAGSGAPSQEAMLTANNAAVAPASGGGSSFSPSASSRVVAGRPVESAYATGQLQSADDDLEIEEID